MVKRGFKAKISSLGILIAWILSGIFAPLFSCGAISQPKLKVVATTSLIASVVQQVGKGEVEVVTIVPSGMCPGHFDIRPGDVKVLEQARLLLEHGFEGEIFLDEMIKLIQNRKISRVTLNVQGNWMVPEVYIRAIDRIVQVLSAAIPEHVDSFKFKASGYKQQILSLGRDIRRQAQELRIAEIKVVCSEMQAEFLTWLGFDIVATYTRPEDFTARELQEIIKKAKDANAALVVDNLQSGAKAGIPIARELSCPHVVLSNFPREFQGQFSYQESLKANAAKLFRALKG